MHLAWNKRSNLAKSIALINCHTVKCFRQKVYFKVYGCSFRVNQLCHIYVCLPSLLESALIRKNLLKQEQILFFNVGPVLEGLFEGKYRKSFKNCLPVKKSQNHAVPKHLKLIFSSKSYTYNNGVSIQLVIFLLFWFQIGTKPFILFSVLSVYDTLIFQ